VRETETEVHAELIVARLLIARLLVHNSIALGIDLVELRKSMARHFDGAAADIERLRPGLHKAVMHSVEEIFSGADQMLASTNKPKPKLTLVGDPSQKIDP